MAGNVINDSGCGHSKMSSFSQPNVDKVNKLSKAWYPKGPKKLSNSIINEVHALVIHHDYVRVEVLATLVETQFLENVLWKHFHEDVTTHHLELILALLLLDHQLKKKTYLVTKLETVLNHDHTDALMKRLLNIPLGMASPSNYLLISLIFKLFGVLTSYYSYVDSVKHWILPLYDIDVKHNFEDYDASLKKQLHSKSSVNKHHSSEKLQSMWWYQVLVNFNETLLDQKERNQLFAILQQELIKLLVVGVSRTSDGSFKQFIIQMNIYELAKTSKEEFGLDVLKYFLYYSQGNRVRNQFYEFQKAIFTLKDAQTKFSELLDSPSLINWTESALAKQVQKDLQEDQLLEVLKQINQFSPYVCSKKFKSHSQKKDILVESIVSCIFLPEFNLNSRNKQIFESFTEDQLYDTTLIGDGDNLFTYVEDEIFPMYGVKFSSSGDYSNRVILNSISKLKKVIKMHLLQVLARLKIDANGNIKGKSKYFHEIKEIRTADSLNNLVEIVTKSHIKSDNDYILLLELVKPNPHSSVSRLKEFGLSSVRLSKIKSTKHNTLFSIIQDRKSFERYEERINYVITLPYSQTIDELEVLTKLPVKSINPFMEVNSSSGMQSSETETTRKRAKYASESKSNEDPQDSINSYPFSFKRSSSVINHSLVKSMAEPGRHLIVVPTETYVKNYQDNSGHLLFKFFDDPHFASYVTELKDRASLIFKKFEYNVNDKYNLNSLGYYEKQIDHVWKKYLKTDSLSKDNFISRYPFNDEIKNLITFKDVYDDHAQIIDTITILKRLSPVLSSETISHKEKWNFIYNNFSIMISYEKYIKLIKSDSFYKQSFDSIKVLNGSFSMVPICSNYSDGPIQQVTFYGGEVTDAFMKLSGSNTVDNLPHPSYTTNPGFAYPYQRIKTDTQIHEAEYSVLLYQYMRLLGYPQSKIGIWVSSPIQKVLVEEVLSAKCIKNTKSGKNLDPRRGSDSNDAFQFGWPDVIYDEAGEYSDDVYEYAILSLFGSVVFELPYKRLPGTRGLYVVDSSNIPCNNMKWPSVEHLRIIAGENFKANDDPSLTSKRDHSREYNIESKDHFEDYIKQMTKVRLG